MREPIAEAMDLLAQQIKQEPDRDFTVERDAMLARAMSEIENLQIALERRTVIGQAIGVIMERYTSSRTQP